jgi:hypothetical protein
MRISGNYFERLLFNVLPWTFLGAFIIYFVATDKRSVAYVFPISTAALWLLDTAIIFVKFDNPQAMRIDNNLRWGRRKVFLSEVLTITPVVDQRFRWTFKMVKFELKDGKTFFIIDKPQTVIADLFDNQFKTVTLILKEFPECWSKLESAKYI